MDALYMGSALKYIGSKRKIIPHILEKITWLQDITSVLDLFSGSARVGVALKEQGYVVHANDFLRFSADLASTLVGEASNLPHERKVEIIHRLENAEPVAGTITRHYTQSSRFFTPENGKKIDGILALIASLPLTHAERQFALTTLILAADKVDSTMGQQMAYLKTYAPRALNPLKLELPPSIPGPGFATNLDYRDALSQISTDLVYCDPPYTHHSYSGLYHVWETIARQDDPEVYGVACKRVDTKEKKSPFNSKVNVRQAFKDLVGFCRSRYLMISYSADGLLPIQEIVGIVDERYRTTVCEIPHQRYIGHVCGIHNPQGLKVGTPGPSKTTEVLIAGEKR